mgnify:CR=1 FL=1
MPGWTLLVVDSTDDSHSEEPVDAASGNVSAASEDYTEEFDYTEDYADYEGTAVATMDDSTEDQAAESEEVSAEEALASDSSRGSYYPIDKSVQLTDVDLENLSAEILHSFEQLTPLTQLQLMDLDLMSNEIIDKEVEASEMSELIRNPRQFGSQRFTFSPEPAAQRDRPFWIVDDPICALGLEVFGLNGEGFHEAFWVRHEVRGTIELRAKPFVGVKDNRIRRLHRSSKASISLDCWVRSPGLIWKTSTRIVW